tara:strand:- start:614 stop:1057 length:444 start_codon:yes stop_codon:yes gene_type:complete
VFENRKYVIFEVSEIDAIDFSQVLETSAETLRKSVDETKTFVKYEVLPAQEEVLYQEGDPEIGDDILYQEGDPELNEDDPMYDSSLSVGDLRFPGIKAGDIRIHGRTGNEIPSSVESLTTKSQEYTHPEILEVLRGEEWTPEMEMPS